MKPSDPRRVVLGYLTREEWEAIRRQGFGVVFAAQEETDDIAVSCLQHHENGVGPVEPWMVDWIWSRNPYLIDREIVERTMGEIVPEKLLDTAAVYAALDRAVHAALQEILGGDHE